MPRVSDDTSVPSPVSFASAFRRAARGVLSLAAPPQCRLCRAALLDHANPFLCPDCAGSLPWIGRGACRGCGFPAGPHARLGDSCSHCRNRNLRLTAAASVARYRGGAKRLALALKFGGETEIARPMAALMLGRLREAGLPAPDYVVPVALHPSRRRRRGFNQAEILAELISGMAGLPLRTGMLQRLRDTRPQSALGREARFDNIREAFRATEEAAGKSVLLVDDVMTTGATMGDCARALRDAGARRVFALVFAR